MHQVRSFSILVIVIFAACLIHGNSNFSKAIQLMFEYSNTSIETSLDNMDCSDGESGSEEENRADSDDMKSSLPSIERSKLARISNLDKVDKPTFIYISRASLNGIFLDINTPPPDLKWNS